MIASVFDAGKLLTWAGIAKINSAVVNVSANATKHSRLLHVNDWTSRFQPPDRETRAISKPTVTLARSLSSALAIGSGAALRARQHRHRRPVGTLHDSFGPLQLHARRFRADLGLAPRARNHGHSRLIEHLRCIGNQKRNITYAAPAVTTPSSSRPRTSKEFQLNFD
jgi:hypothetical protein